MFITIPKVFESMGMGSFIGAAFFIMVFFAALTSSISILETCVSTLTDELKWSRKRATIFMFFEAIALGIPCSLGFGAWDFISIAGLSILDMMDFLASSIFCPLCALLTCLLISRMVGTQKLVDEIKSSSAFKGEAVFRFCVTYLAPVILTLVLVSSVAATLGLIKI